MGDLSQCLGLQSCRRNRCYLKSILCAWRKIQQHIAGFFIRDSAGWSILWTYVVFTVLTCIGAACMRWKVKKFFLGWTLIYFMTIGVWFIGHHAFFTATKLQWEKYGLNFAAVFGRRRILYSGPDCRFDYRQFLQEICQLSVRSSQTGVVYQNRHRVSGGKNRLFTHQGPPPPPQNWGMK